MSETMLSIGWAQESITPEQRVHLHGMFNERISTHVEEPCTATALALEGCDGEQAIWISCDLLNIRLDAVMELRRAVAKRIPGFSAPKLLLSCTHTHNAPNFHEMPLRPGVLSGPAYRDFFIERVADTAAKAWTSRVPGRITPALGHAVIGWCRRLAFADGKGEMYGDSRREDFARVEGPMDPGVELLFTCSADGRPTGAVVNIACTAQTCMGEDFLTADFWGPTRRNLRAHFGDDFTVLAVAGAAGDQCPDDLIRSGRSEPRLRGAEACAILGRRLSRGVIEGYETGRREMPAHPVFKHRHAVFDLPAYVMSAEQIAEYENEIASLTANGDPDPSSWNGGEVRRRRATLKRYAKQVGPEPVLKADCNFLRLGDMGVASSPFELYLEYGQRIKGRSNATQTITAQLTNDTLGYLPTRAALAHGHYSAMPADICLGAEGGDKLVERSVAELNALFAAD